VRITGVSVPDDAVVENTEIGDAVVIDSVPTYAECNVILDAIPIARSEFYNDPQLVGEVPNIPELKAALSGGTGLVKIPGSDGDSGNIYWNALLKGGACVTAADSPNYVVSSMAELVPLVANPPWKCRLLRATIEVDVEINGETVTGGIEVTSCDPRVIPAQHRIYINHSWAGRFGRLNFRGFSNGALEDRGKPGRQAKVVP
jgi:hypothetical protein